MPRKARKDFQVFVMLVLAIAGAVLSLAAVAVMVWGCFNG